MRSMSATEPLLVSGGDIPTLPPVPVRPPPSPEEVSGSFSSYWSDFVDSYNSGPIDEEHDLEDPIDPNDPVTTSEYDAAAAVLLSNTTFTTMSPSAQDAILAIPGLTIALGNFISTGGQLAIGSTASGGLAEYVEQSGTIIITPALANLAPGDTFTMGVLIASVAHELGHELIHDMHSFDVSTRQAYIESGILGEALAIVYSLMIWHDAGQQGITTSVQAGNHNYLYENLYVAFVQNGNMDALMNGITNHLRNNTAYPSSYGSYWDQYYGPGGP